MHVLDGLNLCLSLLGISSLILNIRYLLPRNVAPIVFVLLDETYQLLGCAEDIGAVPPQSEYKRRLDCLSIRFVTMRMKINHAQGMLQQLRIGLWCGLTWKLFPLNQQIKAIRSEIELEVDKKQLDDVGSVASIAMPSPAAVGAIPVDSIAEPALPLPATMTWSFNIRVS